MIALGPLVPRFHKQQTPIGRKGVHGGHGIGDVHMETRRGGAVGDEASTTCSAGCYPSLGKRKGTQAAVVSTAVASRADGHTGESQENRACAGRASAPNQNQTVQWECARERPRQSRPGRRPNRWSHHRTSRTSPRLGTAQEDLPLEPSAATAPRSARVRATAQVETRKTTACHPPSHTARSVNAGSRHSK